MTKGKYTKLVLGSVYKGKDGKPDYLKLDGRSKKILLDLVQGMDEEKGLVLNLDSKKTRLEGVAKAEAEGKLSEEVANKIREEVDKTPEYVRFQVTHLAQRTK